MRSGSVGLGGDARSVPGFRSAEITHEHLLAGAGGAHVEGVERKLCDVVLSVRTRAQKKQDALGWAKWGAPGTVSAPSRCVRRLPGTG